MCFASPVRPSSPRPTTFRMATGEGSFVAIYDYLLPSPPAELPLAKISAVFADRTILQWSVEHPQVYFSRPTFDIWVLLQSLHYIHVLDAINRLSLPYFRMDQSEYCPSNLTTRAILTSFGI